MQQSLDAVDTDCDKDTPCADGQKCKKDGKEVTEETEGGGKCVRTMA